MATHPTRGFGRLLEGTSAACLLVLMLLDLLDVIGRNLLNRPIPWSTEVLEIVVAAMVFLLFPALAYNARHITVDLIKVSAGVRRVQLMLGGVVGAVVFGVISWCVGHQAVRSQGYGEASPILGIPLYLVLYGMTALAVLTTVCFVVSISRGAAGLPASYGTPEPH